MKKRMTALLMAMMLALLAACGNSDKGMAQSNAGAEEKSEVQMCIRDSSVTDYIHVESTVSLAVDGLWRLAREAGLTVKGDTYGMQVSPF